MLVVGTPRPSSALGEVSDNGFFEKSYSSSSSGEYDDAGDSGGNNNIHDATPRVSSKMNDADDLDGGDLWGNDGEDGDARRSSRTRSESFHEMYESEKAKSSPIVLAGDQPLLTRQLNIVTNLNPTTYEAKQRPWGAPSKEEMAEEELLEKEEASLLEKWRAVGGRGKPDLPSAANDSVPGKKGKKKSLAGSGTQTTASSALIPSAGGVPVQNATVNLELLPRYEDKVQLLVLMPSSANAKAKHPRVEMRTVDLPDVAGRRVHCLLWELSDAEAMEEPLLEAYLRGNDALCVLEGYSEWTSRCISRALALERPVVVTSAFGPNPAEAKKNASRLGVHFDIKNSLWAEIVARDVTLRGAKSRSEPRSVTAIMEKQLKRTEKGKSGSEGGSSGGGGGSCTSM